MAKRTDAGHKETDKVLEDLEKQITKEYSQAEKEIAEKLDDYLKRFETKDKIKAQAVKDGKITQKEYEQWRVGQIAVGERWSEMRDTIAQDLTNASQLARSMTGDTMPEVYAINHNYGTFQVEKTAHLDTSYTLYDRDTVQRLFNDENTIYHKYGKRTAQRIAEGKQLAWDKKQVQSCMIQSLLQGESIGNIATRLSKTVGDSDRKASIRNARTMTTGIENAGRVDAYQRAEDMGIELEQEWMATLDDRTRHEHRMLDGQRVKVGEKFKIDGYELEYPADPKGAPEMVYNCRCTLVPALKGHEADTSMRNMSKSVEDEYEKWKESHYSYSDSITKQDDIAEVMKEGYRQEYVYLAGGNPNIPSDVQYQKKILNNENENKKEFVFVPAESLEEAENFIKQYVDDSQFGALGVSYKGIGIDVANDINKTIATFYETYNVDKFGGVYAPKKGTKLYDAIEGAYAGYSKARNSIILNKTDLISNAYLENKFKEEQNSISSILKNPEKYDMSLLTDTAKRIINNSRESGRGSVPENIIDSINHELGHSLETMVYNHESYAMVATNMSKYSPKLSGYACESMSEYLAESFCSYQKGENICDPELIKVFKSFER